MVMLVTIIIKHKGDPKMKIFVTGVDVYKRQGVDRTPVAVFAGRKMVTPAYFLGVVYACLLYTSRCV